MQFSVTSHQILWGEKGSRFEMTRGGERMRRRGGLFFFKGTPFRRGERYYKKGKGRGMGPTGPPRKPLDRHITQAAGADQGIEIVRGR